MSHLPLPAYTDLEQALDNTALALHPSQAHGLICGLLCGHRGKTATWEAFVSEGQNKDDADNSLKILLDISDQQLSGFDFEFALLLPPEESALMLRAEALTLWCQGFLTGLTQAKIPVSHREPGEATEAIDDLIEIAKMNYEAVISSEEDETAYVELVEFVRMAVILIFQEMREDESQGASKSTPVH